jgi:hypothetical protein
MYRAADFKSYFLNIVGASANTANTYNSFLSRIDRAIGGLDEAIARDGPDRVLNWALTTNEPPFDIYRSHARSVLKRYVLFVTNPDELVDVEGEVNSEPGERVGLAFQLEREMQAGVRKQLTAIEPGLTAIDGGIEIITPVGRPDILAQDKNGDVVIIELKAGVCPTTAIEQILGYMQAIEDDRGVRVRGILIASDFADRTRAAGKRLKDVKLLRYEFLMHFNSVA